MGARLLCDRGAEDAVVAGIILPRPLTGFLDLPSSHLGGSCMTIQRLFLSAEHEAPRRMRRLPEMSARLRYLCTALRSQPLAHSKPSEVGGRHAGRVPNPGASGLGPAWQFGVPKGTPDVWMASRCHRPAQTLFCVSTFLQLRHLCSGNTYRALRYRCHEIITMAPRVGIKLRGTASAHSF